MNSQENSSNALIGLDSASLTARFLTREAPVIESHTDTKFNSMLYLPEGEVLKGDGGLRTKGYIKKSLLGKPLITVITVVLNGEKHLEETILSVLDQTYNNVEYIIIDGGSTDGTVALIKKYEEQIDYWVSEKDDGIYYAMNKGIDLAHGNFVYHLNLGDRLLKLPALFEDTVSEDVICIAGVVQTSTHGFHIPSAGVALRFHNTLHHQGCFYRKTKDLRYNICYKVFSDFDLNQRLLKIGGRFVLCSDLVAVHGNGGISHTTNRFFEVYSIVQHNFGIFWVAVCFVYFKYRGILMRLRLK